MSDETKVDEPITDEGLLIGLIKESEVALRGVNRQDEKYMSIVASIRKVGVLNPVVVRDLGDGTYALVDGLQRYTGSKDAGKTRIPVHVVDVDEAGVMEAQIITNLAKVDTKPVQYTKQLVRILGASPLMTLSELAEKLCQNKKWVEQRLNLLKLDPAIQPLVDSDEIKLANAYALAKLPVEEQKGFVDRAITDTAEAFIPTVNARVKELKTAAKEGREANTEFVPQPRLQKLGVIKEEFEKPMIAASVCKSLGAKTAEDGFAAAIKWALRMDPASQKAAVEDNDRRTKEAKAAKERRKKEREAQKKKDAAEKAADISSL